MSSLLYAFYGDDFTGSTDLLESLTLGGIESVLFIGPPSQKHLESFRNCRAVGIAGESRSQTPEWMSSHLPMVFQKLKALEAPITHYKICSTFDSSPTHGSIGRAMELAWDIFAPEFIPIVVGAPHLGRYVIFGNLFAKANGKIYRIDEHPTMRCHPVTPMTESNLRKHLALQTSMQIGLVDLLALRERPAAALATERALGVEAVLFDSLDKASLSATGELLLQHARRCPIFAVGSSGLAESLIHQWHSEGIASPRHQSNADAADQVLVLSGSCSPITEQQIRWALENGFSGISIDPTKLVDPNTEAAMIAETRRKCIAELTKGQSIVLYTALGPLPRGARLHGEQLGKQLGSLLKLLLEETSLRRVILCGGDTSSHAIQQLGLYALTWLAFIEPGAPLCRAHTDNEIFRDLELVLKGGQMGQQDFFARVRAGG
jgi:uncharacterized protein YgbK (DUF1537 family)